MAISGLQVINIGLQNESTGSDSLYAAFNKTKTNFTTLFACASPYTSFTGINGISVTANANVGTVSITNTGVTQIIAGTGITIDQANGNVTISSTGGDGNGAGTVTSIGLQAASNDRLSISGSPIVSAGNITVDLAPTGVIPGTYTYPTLNVDAFGRVIGVSSGASVGTVTSVGISPGFGIQVSGSPITTAGAISILNTGVTRVSAGTGITLSGSNGNVTISTAAGAGTVTSVAMSSSSLVVTGSPVVNAGTIVVDLPANVSASRFTSTVATGTAPLTINSTTLVANLHAAAAGNVTANSQPNITSVGTLLSLSVTGNINAGNLTATTITGTLSGNATLAGSVTTNAQANITSVGILSSLSVSANANVGGLRTSGIVSAAGNITGSNIITAGRLVSTLADGTAPLIVTSTTQVANLNVATAGTADSANTANTATTAGTVTTAAQGNITSVGTLSTLSVSGNINLTGRLLYTPSYGSFYSNVTQTNPVANTAMPITLNNSFNGSSNGVSIVSNSQITIENPGTYNIQFSAQVAKTGGGAENVEIWLAKNGTPVDYTNTVLLVTSGNPAVAAWNFVEPVSVANTYYELYWTSTDVNVSIAAIPAGTSPTRPATPSVILTVVPVGA